MKKILKKLVTTIFATTMVMAMSVTAFAATTETLNVNTTLYKTGTSTTSMGNAAFANGGTLVYNYSENGESIVSTDVILNVSSVTYAGIFTGYITQMKLAGVTLDGKDVDGDGNFDVFSGKITGKVELGTEYVVAVNISVSGFMNSDTKGDLVFTAK